MFLAIEELFYLFQLFLSGDSPLSIENVSPDSHIFKVFLYLYTMSTIKELSLQVGLTFFNAEILRNVPNITNLTINTVAPSSQETSCSWGTGIMGMPVALAGISCKVKSLKLFLNLGWILLMEKSYIIQSSSCFSYPGSSVLQNDKSFVIDSTQSARLSCILFPSVNNRLTGKTKQKKTKKQLHV